MTEETRYVITRYVGILFRSDNPHWIVTCPCEVTTTFPINELPVVDTPHPCGVPDHWSVKFE